MTWRIHYQTPRQKLTFIKPTPERRKKVAREIIGFYEKPIAEAHRSEQLRLIEDRKRLLALATNGNYLEHPNPPKRFEITEDVLAVYLDRAFSEVASWVLKAPFVETDREEFDKNRIQVGYSNPIKFLAPKYFADVNLLEEDKESGYKTYLAVNGDIYIVPKDETIQLPLQ